MFSSLLNTATRSVAFEMAENRTQMSTTYCAIRFHFRRQNVNTSSKFFRHTAAATLQNTLLTGPI